jgi:hypothetical protein
MNGTLLFRRSASMVLASSFLLVAACGVEMNGLFPGDEADGAVRRDGGDASFADGSPDSRLDGRADVAATDGSSTDRSTNDGAGDDRGGSDGAAEPAVDAGAGSDARDASGGAIDSRDAFVEGDVVDARVDSDGPSDAGSDPVQDPVAEDTTADPRIDLPLDVGSDTVADARDASADVVDAGAPGSCTGICNTFDNVSQTVTRTVDQGSPPTMTGGTIVDGTYVVTSIVQYNGDVTPYSLKETSVIGGNMDAWVAETNGMAAVRYTTTFTTTSNQMAFTFCCPIALNLTILYTTDGTTLSHIDSSNPNRVITYTRR